MLMKAGTEFGGFHLGWLGHVGGRCPSARLAVFDFEDHVVGRGDADRLAVEQGDAADRSFFEVLPGVVDLFGRELVLLVVGGVHEDELVALVVEELALGFLDVGGVERVAVI